MPSITLAERPRVMNEDDFLGAMIALGALPRRESDCVELDLAAYRAALEGDQPGVFVVCAHDLTIAVRRILQGACGHAFHPSSAELRMRCDTVRDERCETAAREMRKRRLDDEAAGYRMVEHSKEQRVRVAAIYQRFCREHEQRRGHDPESEIASIRAKWDPAVLASIPDRPIDQSWKGGADISAGVGAEILHHGKSNNVPVENIFRSRAGGGGEISHREAMGPSCTPTPCEAGRPRGFASFSPSKADPTRPTGEH